MAQHTVLIVEDHKDLARMVGAGLRALDLEIQVISVPSGEEALLVAGDQPVQLLVSEVQLPGMTGLDLMRQLKARLPDLKAILITGSTDHALRKQVANAGAEAFFFKPVEFADLMGAVRRCLDPGQPTGPLPPPQEPEEEEEPETVGQRLSRIRTDLSALSVILLDDRGKQLAQAGDFSLPDEEGGVVPALMATFSAAGRLAHALEADNPQNLTHINGPRYSLHLAHVGQAYALLVAVPPGPMGPALGAAAPVIAEAVSDLVEILTRMGVSLEPEAPPPAPPEAPAPVAEEEEEDASELDALLEQADTIELSAEELDDFWAVPEKSVDTGSLNADDLSYDQARKLGLAPSDN